MRSLRAKLILYMSLLVFGLVGAAGFIEVNKRQGELQEELLLSSKNFSAVSAQTLLERTQTLYYQPERFPELEGQVREVMSRSRDLSRVQVVDTLFGIVLFDSKEFEDGYYGFKRTPRVFEQQALLSDIALDKLVVDRSGHAVRVVVPRFTGKEITDPLDVNRA